MGLKWNGEQRLAEIQGEAASRILKAAVHLQVALMRKINASNPRPHKTPSREGEYLKKRTGALQAAVGYEPVSVTEVRAQGKVRVGYRPSGFYGAVWEKRGTRKGLAECLEEERAAIQAIVSGG